MKLKYFFSILSIAILSTAFGQRLDIGKWDYLLKKYVDENGVVNYAEWARDPSLLEEFLVEAQAFGPTEEWTDNQKKAHWINLYNAGTVMIIISHYPVESITNIDNAFNRPIGAAKGKSFSLDEIEKEILNQFGDPRIHFAINCGSKSCPKLSNTAFRAENVEYQLNKLTKDFINDPKHNDLKDSRSIFISEIFQWYPQDFGETPAEIVAFINEHAKTRVSEKAYIQYFPYDWSLNGR